MLSVSLADYGVGNLHSLKKALELCGAEVRLVSDMKELQDADCIAFPGVGAFDRTMSKLLPYRDEIRSRMDSGVPCIGICIGMQIMMDKSEEGESPGLGFIKGDVSKVKARQIPHMGWNEVTTDDDLFENIDKRFFYFTHSYYGNPSEKNTIRGTTEYEGIEFPVYFRKKNVVGTQFHPEKSSRSGLMFLKNFVKYAEGSQ